MSRPLVVDLFAEDHAHAAFLVPLIRRIATEEATPVEVQVRAARGGHGRVLQELALYQDAVRSGVGAGFPGLLVVAIDANCRGLSEARREIGSQLSSPFSERSALACPNPHVERWYLADLEAFGRAVGSTPAVPRGKCERDFYKRILAGAVVDAGNPAMLGGIEFAAEIVAAMSLYRAGKADSSLKHFVDDLRGLLRQA